MIGNLLTSAVSATQGFDLKQTRLLLEHRISSLLEAQARSLFCNTGCLFSPSVISHRIPDITGMSVAVCDRMASPVRADCKRHKADTQASLHTDLLPFEFNSNQATP